MSEFDQLLGDVFTRVAEPGDPTGVADAIRSRVAAGDPGTPSDGASFGGGGWSWLPWIGGGLVVATVGAVAGMSGLFGAFGTSAVAGPPPSFGVSEFVSGLDCPGGSPVVALEPGDRVLAVARSDDSAYLGVRSPADRSRTVWIALDVLELDAGQPAVPELEIDGCPEPLIDIAEPEAEPEPGPQPEPGPEPGPEPQPEPQPGPVTPPAPEPDTTSPTLGTPTGVTPINCSSPPPETTTIAISATDNKAVTGVAINWSAQYGQDSGSGQMSKSGSSWTFTYNPPDQFGSGGNVTFTMTARDAAGNQSESKSYVVYVACLF